MTWYSYTETKQAGLIPPQFCIYDEQNENVYFLYSAFIRSFISNKYSEDQKKTILKKINERKTVVLIENEAISHEFKKHIVNLRKFYNRENMRVPINIGLLDLDTIQDLMLWLQKNPNFCRKLLGGISYSKWVAMIDEFVRQFDVYTEPQLWEEPQEEEDMFDRLLPVYREYLHKKLDRFYSNVRTLRQNQMVEEHVKTLDAKWHQDCDRISESIRGQIERRLLLELEEQVLDDLMRDPQIKEAANRVISSQTIVDMDIPDDLFL